MQSKNIWLNKNIVFLTYLPLFNLCTHVQPKKDISHIGFPTPVKK
jgi:hypothetical protein